MNEKTRKFNTKNFSVIWNEYEPDFIDPWAHGQAVADAVDEGRAMLTHMNATVYFHDMEFGNARLIDCIYVCADTDNPYGHDRVIAKDHSYRRKVVRWAISDARKQLAEVQSDWPGLYIRKTA